MPNHPSERLDGPDPMRGQFFSNAVTRLCINNPSLRALSPRYCLVKPLGAARGVESYLMRNRESGEVVQVRVLSTTASEDSRQVELFHIQAGAASVLSHPRVFACSMARQEGSVHFAVTEHKRDCDTLRRLLDREGWLSFHRAARVASDLAECLDYARSRGIMHLSLEPDNVHIARDGSAFLSGFGMPVDPGLA